MLSVLLKTCTLCESPRLQTHGHFLDIGSSTAISAESRGRCRSSRHVGKRLFGTASRPLCSRGPPAVPCRRPGSSSSNTRQFQGAARGPRNLRFAFRWPRSVCFPLRLHLSRRGRRPRSRASHVSLLPAAFGFRYGAGAVGKRGGGRLLRVEGTGVSVGCDAASRRSHARSCPFSSFPSNP